MKISTIIPMYNSKDTIKSAIESVLNQTYKEPIEIIVVNDGSKDGCEKIVEEMITNNPTNRVIKLINKPNGGVSSARNRGIKESSGEYILFLDSDDIYRKSLLEDLEKIIEESVDLISFGYKRELGINKDEKIYLSDKFHLKTFSGSEFVKIFLQKQLFQHICSFCIKRSLIIKNNIEFNENVTLGEDITFQIKSMSVSRQCIYLAKCYFIYSYNVLSVTNSKLSEKHLSYINNYKDVKEFLINTKNENLLSYLNFYYQYEFFYILKLFLLDNNKKFISIYLEYSTILKEKIVFLYSKKYLILGLLKLLFKISPSSLKFILKKI